MKNNPNHTYILCRDFNIDIIALIGKLTNQQTTTPQVEDDQWQTFTYNHKPQYIPKYTSMSRQGGHNYTENSLTYVFA